MTLIMWFLSFINLCRPSDNPFIDLCVLSLSNDLLTCVFSLSDYPSINLCVVFTNGSFIICVVLVMTPLLTFVLSLT